MLSIWGYIFAIFFIVVPSVATGIFLNWQQLKDFWGWFMEWVKRGWTWCKLLLTSIRKRLAGWLLFLAFGSICFAIWLFAPYFYKIYFVLSDQINTEYLDVFKPKGGAGEQVGGTDKQVGGTRIIDSYFSISIRYFGIVAAAGAIIGYIIAIARNLISDNENKISEQGRIAEQISRAIDQISSYKQSFGSKTHEPNMPNVEARVGGIYSLERIAQDSDRDYVKIMDILCAYVRATAPLEGEKIKAREDIQAVIDILGDVSGIKTKRSVALERRAKFRINLENCDLSNYRFNEGDFNRYTKNGKNGAIFDKSLFKDALFQQADLSYVSFDGATLTGASFEYATLKGARFVGAHVEGADFSNAKYLFQDQLNEMLGDEKTKIPDRKNISRPQHWLIPKSKKP